MEFVTSKMFKWKCEIARSTGIAYVTQVSRSCWAAEMVPTTKVSRAVGPFNNCK